MIRVAGSNNLLKTISPYSKFYTPSISRFWFSQLDGRKIKVASLNYCGIMNNPYQFYSQEYQQELSTLSYGFFKVLQSFFPGFNKAKHTWSCSRLDQKLRKRYSPLFFHDAGIDKTTNSFETLEKLQESWQKRFQQNCIEAGIKKTATFQQQKYNLKQFDLLIFHTLLNNVYNEKQKQPLPLQQLLKMPVQPYLKRYKPFHELSFIDAAKKTKIVETSVLQVEDPDIVAIQQASKDLIQQLQNNQSYELVGQHAQNKILVKKSQFNKKRDPNQVLQQATIQLLKSIQRNSLACFDNFVFLGVHLRSAKELAQKEWVVLSKFIDEVTTKHPQLKLIVLGDGNMCIGQKVKDRANLHCFPPDNKTITTMKKRTYLQAQYKKAQVEVKEAKEFILSNCELTNNKVLKLGEKPGAQSNREDRIPSKDHPFDHYIITSEVKIQK